MGIPGESEVCEGERVVNTKWNDGTFLPKLRLSVTERCLPNSARPQNVPIYLAVVRSPSGRFEIGEEML